MNKFFVYLMISFALLANINYDVQLEKSLKLDLEEFNTKEARGDWNRLGKQTISVGVLSLATMGVLYMLPEEFTNWDRREIRDVRGKWERNVKRGPVWDHDDFALNWIGHPYVGSVYYVAARKSDFNEFDSFLYSLAMSTFFWEYGIEAFAETPSIQDLIITPVIGSFLGEYLYRQEKKILANDGRIADSRFLGKTALFFIDPLGVISNWIGFKDDKVEGFWSVGSSTRIEDDKVKVEPTLGLSLNIKF